MTNRIKARWMMLILQILRKILWEVHCLYNRPGKGIESMIAESQKFEKEIAREAGISYGNNKNKWYRKKGRDNKCQPG